MGGEEGFKIGPCMADILLFHDKVRSKTFKNVSEPGDVGGFWEVANDNRTTG